MASPVRRRFGTVPPEHDAKLGQKQKLLLRLLRKRKAKRPDGVDRAMLRSHFIQELTAERAREGKEPLAPDAAAAAFRQVLFRLKGRR
jgi:hypothetical protein